MQVDDKTGGCHACPWNEDDEMMHVGESFEQGEFTVSDDLMTLREAFTHGTRVEHCDGTTQAWYDDSGQYGPYHAVQVKSEIKASTIDLLEEWLWQSTLPVWRARHD